MHEDRLLNISEAARFLGISEEQIKELVKSGKLIAYHIGGMYLRFKLGNLQDFKNSKQSHLQHKPSAFFDNVRDFFYFNDFYIAATLLIAILLLIILRNISQ